MAGFLRILLVRHGQTDSNAGGVLQGHLPTPLNAAGRDQALRLAGRLAGLRPAIDVLLSSDLRRATETAEPIAQALGLTTVLDERWRERGFGSLEGTVVGNTDVWRAATGTWNPPGAEPIQSVEARVAGALEDVRTRYAARQAVVVVTHGGVVRTALRLFASGILPMGTDQEPPGVPVILNASILHLAVGADRGWRVVQVNDVGHLAAGPGRPATENVDPNA